MVGSPTSRCARCVHYVFTLSNSPAGKRRRCGDCRRPAVVRTCPPRKQSRRVKRRKALVRKPPHPVATLRSGQSLQRKGLPAHDAGRRALRRFTAVISVEPRSTRSGRAFLSGLLRVRPVVQQSTLHTGLIARRDDARGAPSVRLIRPDPQTPLPAPPTAITCRRPRTSRDAT